MIEHKQTQLMELRIQQFNEFVMAQDIEKMPVGLFCGKMGLSIYYYHQWQIYKNKSYKKFADKLLDSTISKLHTKTLISLEDGLIGVCLGLNYLIENNFQKGNVNNILSDLDDKIFQKAWFEYLNNIPSSLESLNSIIEIALYFSIRLKNKDINKHNRFLFESIVIKSINLIQNNGFHIEKNSEPLSFTLNEYFIVNYLYLLSLVNQLDFYQYKISKIIDELYPKLYCLYPYNQSNRLQLSTTLSYLNSTLKKPLIEKYIDRLNADIEYKYIINEEFQDQNLLLANGLCGMYLQNSILFGNNRIPSDTIIQRIRNSGIWNEINGINRREELTKGLFTGLAGVILIFQHLTHKRDEI
jgi:hypothetical protein